ncbi:hypothetical protein C8Q70DRAFT_474436 [Cubamyces menziesii]|nr:hypothetical protein C8Q70DRAFT_474436 [Cubamyces menziesii]
MQRRNDAPGIIYISRLHARIARSSDTCAMLPPLGSPRPLPLPPLPSVSTPALQEPQVKTMGDVQEQSLSQLDESIKRLEPQAEDEVEEVERILDQLPLIHGRQEAEEMAKKLVEGVSHVIDYLGAVAQLHPAAGIVVGALSQVVSLELQRHENNAHIVVVHTTMVKTVYHVRFLARIQVKFEEDIEERMKIIFKHMGETIRDFGAFVDTYHTCWQKTYKVLFAHVHKRKLEHFGNRFQQHKEDLDEMKKTLTQMQLSTVILNTEKILNALKIDEPDVQKAEAFIQRNGGPDEATLGMKEMLRQGFDDVLEKHTARYMKKLENVQDAVIASVSASQTAILSRLNEGPHILIEDEEIRAIWERNRWKSCVKSRIFIEGIHEHYQTKFHEHGSHGHSKDAWTLPFFSRAMYHSAIGDIVDDDGSGYLSASEVNEFISGKRSMPHWTNPQWFAWAGGWYNNNVWYHRHIKRMLQEMATSLSTVGTSERSSHSIGLVQRIVESLTPLVLVADVEDPARPVKVPHQLRRLQEEYRSYEEQFIQTNLSHFGNHISDKSCLHAVIQNTRIELYMMALLKALIMRLQMVVAEAVSSNQVDDRHLITIEELATSCIVVFVAFEDRMRDLVRSWRFEGKEIGMQVDRYADGLFRKCYRQTHTYERAYDDLRGCIFGNELTLPRHLRPFSSGSRIQTSVDGLSREVTVLSERVQTLEDRLDKAEQPQQIERRSRSLSSASSASATDHVKEEPTQATPSNSPKHPYQVPPAPCGRRTAERRGLGKILQRLRVLLLLDRFSATLSAPSHAIRSYSQVASSVTRTISVSAAGQQWCIQATAAVHEARVLHAVA